LASHIARFVPLILQAAYRNRTPLKQRSRGSSGGPLEGGHDSASVPVDVEDGST